MYISLVLSCWVINIDGQCLGNPYNYIGKIYFVDVVASLREQLDTVIDAVKVSWQRLCLKQFSQVLLCGGQFGCNLVHC